MTEKEKRKYYLAGIDGLIEGIRAAVEYSNEKKMSAAEVLGVIECCMNTFINYYNTMLRLPDDMSFEDAINKASKDVIKNTRNGATGAVFCGAPKSFDD